MINSCSGRFTAANSRKQRTDLQKTDMMLFYLRFFLLLKTDRPSSLSLLSDSLFSVLWPWHPFSRTYGVNLPSSLTTLLPLALGFSPHLPVSVCGTGTFILDRGFSRQCRIKCFGTFFPSPSRLRIIRRICLPDFLFLLDEYFQLLVHSISLRPPFSQTDNGGTGISTCCPSPTPFGLSLGPD